MDNPIIINRIKSFCWRFVAYIVSIALAWLADNIGLLELNPFITTIVGLGLGELTKWWNNRQATLGKTFFGRTK